MKVNNTEEILTVKTTNDTIRLEFDEEAEVYKINLSPSITFSFSEPDRAYRAVATLLDGEEDNEE